MDGGEVTRTVLRQGTFDTDPTQTLVDSKGTVKRGSIELPNIDEKPRFGQLKSKPSELSIDSRGIDDVSHFLKTLKSTVRVSRSKSLSTRSTSTNTNTPLPSKPSHIKFDGQTQHSLNLKAVKHSRPNSQSPGRKNVLEALNRNLRIADKITSPTNTRQARETRGENLEFDRLQTIISKPNSKSPIDTREFEEVADESGSVIVVESFASRTTLVNRIPLMNAAPPIDTNMSQSQQRAGGGRVLETYESIYAERKSLLENEVSYQKRIKQLEQELYSLLRTTDDLRAENKVLRMKLDTVEEDNRELKGDRRMQRLMRDSTLSPRLDSDKFEMDSQMDKLKEQNRKLQEERRNLNKQLSPRDEISALETENVELRTGMLKLSQQMDAFEKEHEKMKEDYNKERELLKAEINKVNERLKIGSERPDGETVQLKEQIVSLQTENQKQNSELANLNEQLNKANKLVTELKQQQISLQSSITSVESEKLTELQHLKNEYDKMESECENAKASKHELESERDELLSRNKVMETQTHKLEEENKKLTEELSQKKTDTDELLKSLKNSNNDSEKELQKERQQKMKVQRQCNDLKKNLETKKVELEEMKIQMDKAESEKVKIKKDFDIFKKSCDGKESSMSELGSQLQETKETLKKEMAKQDGLLKGAGEKHKELQRLQQQEAKCKSEKDKALSELGKSNEEIASLKQKIISHTNEISSLRNEIEVLGKGEQTCSSDLDNKVKSTRQELDKSRSDNAMLTSELRIKTEACQDLSQQLYELNLRMGNINTKIKQMEFERKELLVHREKYIELDSSHRRLIEEIRHLRKLSGREDGWMTGLFDGKDITTAEYVGSIHAKKVSRRQKENKLVMKTVTQGNKASKSMTDLRQEEVETLSQKSTPSLPCLPTVEESSNSPLSCGLGYRQIHQKRMKAASKLKRQ